MISRWFLAIFNEIAVIELTKVVYIDCLRFALISFAMNINNSTYLIFGLSLW